MFRFHVTEDPTRLGSERNLEDSMRGILVLVLTGLALIAIAGCRAPGGRPFGA